MQKIYFCLLFGDKIIALGFILSTLPSDWSSQLSTLNSCDNIWKLQTNSCAHLFLRLIQKKAFWESMQRYSVWLNRYRQIILGRPVFAGKATRLYVHTNDGATVLEQLVSQSLLGEENAATRSISCTTYEKFHEIYFVERNVKTKSIEWSAYEKILGYYLIRRSATYCPTTECRFKNWRN